MKESGSPGMPSTSDSSTGVGCEELCQMQAHYWMDLFSWKEKPMRKETKTLINLNFFPHFKLQKFRFYIILELPPF